MKASHNGTHLNIIPFREERKQEMESTREIKKKKKQDQYTDEMGGRDAPNTLEITV